MSAPLRDIGDRIRSCRERAGMTPRDVAETCGISQSQLNRYEKGHKVPSTRTVVRLARCFGCSTDELLGA